jgi:hypothetical protein
MTRCERSRGSGENFSCRRAHARTTLMGSRTIYGRSVSVIRGVVSPSSFMQRGGFHETLRASSMAIRCIKPALTALMRLFHFYQFRTAFRALVMLLCNRKHKGKRNMNVGSTFRGIWSIIYRDTSCVARVSLLTRCNEKDPPVSISRLSNHDVRN